MPRASTVRYTYADHQSIPEDHRRHEIVDGELFVTSLPRFNHQQVARDVMLVLEARVREHDLGVAVGRVTVHLEDELVLEPDVVFIRKDRLRIADPEGDVHGPPDLVVEVLSPSTKSYDRNLKRKRYLESGVGEVWIIDIDERMVEVWRQDSEEPERVRDVLHWYVAGRAFDIPLIKVVPSDHPPVPVILTPLARTAAPPPLEEPNRLGYIDADGPSGSWLPLPHLPERPRSSTCACGQGRRVGQVHPGQGHPPSASRSGACPEGQRGGAGSSHREA